MMIKNDKLESICESSCQNELIESTDGSFRQNEPIESIYESFCQKEQIAQKKEDIEYLGINLSSDKRDVEFKLYYKDTYSRKEPHPIVEKLDERGMIRTLTQIIDTRNGKCRRFDIGLGNRTNEPMEKLLDEIQEMAPFCTPYQEEIRQMSRMKVCEKPEYAYAALYFWGFIEKDDVIEAMKMHYLTRICENPDKLGKRVIFDDVYYLDYLEKMGISQFQEMLPVVRQIVSGKDGILWMIGVDYFRQGNHKYKIYFKTPTDIYMRKMKAALDGGNDKCRKLAEQLEQLEKWLAFHSELFMDGVAVCLDMKNCWSLNFYFKWKDWPGRESLVKGYGRKDYE